MSAPRYVVGVDLGQAADPTAICVLQVTREQRKVFEHQQLKWRTIMAVRHLERLKLHTNYIEQVAHVRRMLHRPPLRLPDYSHLRSGVRPQGRRTELIIDQTGVGRHVYETFEAAGLNPTGVTITSGDGQSRDPNKPGCYRVAKILLVSRLQAAMHAGELVIDSNIPDASTLRYELQEFRAQISDAGTATFGARARAHDDLVLALAMAVWGAEHDARLRINSYELAHGNMGSVLTVRPSSG